MSQSKNNTESHKKPTFLPRLRKSRKVDGKIGDQYYAALKEAVFSMNNPYIPSEPPETVRNNFRNSLKYFRCEQCNDSFRFAHTYEEHKTRRCWILGYWCVQCYAPPCTHKKDTICRFCSALEEKKRWYLRSRGLTKNQKPGTIKIFYNQCEFFEHLKKHNVASPESDDLMLMPLPSSITKSDYPKMDKICSPMFERMFLLKTHVADWLKSRNIYNTWWKIADNENSSMNYLTVGFKSEEYFDGVFESLMKEKQNGTESPTSDPPASPVFIDLDNSEEEEREKTASDNGSSPHDIAFVDCGPTPKTYIMNLTKPAAVVSAKPPVKIVSPALSGPKISVKKFATDQNWKKTVEQPVPSLIQKPQKPQKSAGVTPNLIPISSAGGVLQGQKLNADTKILTVRGPKGVDLSTLIKQLPQDVINNKKIVFVGQQTTDKPSGLKVSTNPKATTYKSIMPMMYDNNKPQFIRILPTPTPASTTLTTTASKPAASTMSEVKINGMSVQTLNKNGQVLVKKRSKIVQLPTPVKVSSANIIIKPASTDTTVTSTSLNATPSNGNNLSVDRVLRHVKTDFTGESLETYEHPTEGWILRSATKPKNAKNVQTVFRYRQKMLQNFEQLSPREIKKCINHFKTLDKRCKQTISSKAEKVSLGHGQMIKVLENALEKAEARATPSKEAVVDEEYESFLNKWEMGLHLHELTRCETCNKVCKPKNYVFGMSQESKKPVLYCTCNEYICYKCNLYQGSNPRFRAHLEYHRKEESNACPECFQKFDGYKELAVHLWTSCFHILTRRLLGCTVCQVGGFENEEALARHFSTMHMTKSVTCSKCLRVFGTHAECREHQSTEHPGQQGLHIVKLLICDVGECVVDPKLFRSHMSSHLGTQKLIYYKCPVCSAYIKDSGRGKEVVKLHLYVYHLDKLSEIIEKDVLAEIISSGVPDTVRAYDDRIKKEKKTKFKPKIIRACSITPEAFDSASENADFEMDQSDSSSEVRSITSSNSEKRENKRKKKKKSQKPGRIALNGPSSSENNESQDYKCHLCGELINTSWAVVRDHFRTRHSDTYQLSILTPKLLRISNEFIERGYQEYVSKKRKTEPTISPSKRRKRWTPKKTSDALDKLSGMCVTPESSSGDNSCEKCDKRCETMEELRKHIATSHRIKGMYLICLECGDNFIVAPSLQMHLKAFHGIEDPISYLDKNPLHTAEEVDDLEEKMRNIVENQCHVCMAVFEDKVAVDKHLRVHGMAFLNRKRIEARKAIKSPEIEKMEVEQDAGIKIEVEEEKKSDEINE